MFESMPGAAGFLSAIRETPNDTTNWLVFADWLSDHGDDRADWLRHPTIRAWLTPEVRDPVPALIRDLGSAYWRDWRTDEVLRKLGTYACEAVRRWTQEDPPARWHKSRWFLGVVRPAVLPGVPELIAALASESWYECWQSVIDLGFHGSDAAPAVRALIDADHYDPQFAKNGDHDPLFEAIIAVLTGLGSAATEAIPYLYDKLEGPPCVQEAAQTALDAIGPYDPERMFAEVRLVECEYRPELALIHMVRAHPQRYGVLARVLRGEVSLDEPVRQVYQLLRPREDKPPELRPDEIAALVPALVEILQRHPAQVDEWGFVIEMLTAMGEPARPALPALQEALSRCLAGELGETYVRECLACAIGQFGDTETAIAVLVPSLSSSEHYLRGTSLERLARIGVAEAVRPAIAGLLDPDEYVRSMAAMSLTYLVKADSDPAVFMPAMLGALNDPAVEVRRNVLYAISKMPAARADERVIAACIAALNGDVTEAGVAREVLATDWDVIPRQVAEHLLRFLSSMYPGSTEQAIRGLEKIDVLPDEVIPLLIDLFASCNSDAAADLLVRIGERAVPNLIEATKIGEPRRRAVAVRTLGRLASADAVPVILEALDDQNPEVRRAAQEAQQGIDRLS